MGKVGKAMLVRITLVSKSYAVMLGPGNGLAVSVIQAGVCFSALYSVMKQIRVLVPVRLICSELQTC